MFALEVIGGRLSARAFLGEIIGAMMMYKTNLLKGILAGAAVSLFASAALASDALW